MSQSKEPGEYRCFADGDTYPGCVFDGSEGLHIADCICAQELHANNLGRDDCQWWRKVPVMRCPHCDHVL